MALEYFPSEGDVDPEWRPAEQSYTAYNEVSGWSSPTDRPHTTHR
jgi:hypothetical protein